MMMAQQSPIIQARMVSTGISMSSVLDTAARTSGKGDSSSHSSRGAVEGVTCVACGFTQRNCVTYLRCSPKQSRGSGL